MIFGVVVVQKCAFAIDLYSLNLVKVRLVRGDYLMDLICFPVGCYPSVQHWS